MVQSSPDQQKIRSSVVLQGISAQPDVTTATCPAAGGEAGSWRQMFRALRHRNFRLFVSGQVISLVGTWMQQVAQSWLIYRLTHSEMLLGTTWFCLQIPVFLLGPFGGLAADRHSRHKIVILTQTLAMFQALLLALLTLSGKVAVWHILSLAVALGMINAFDMPARQALLVHMTGKEDLLNAISLNSAIFNSARVVGPALAGILVATLGEGYCFLLNGVSFLAVIGCLFAMRLAPISRTIVDSPWAHLVDGFRYVHRTLPVRSLLLMMAAVTLSVMPVMVLLPFFADEIFHRGSLGFGVLSGGMGVGAVAGTLVLAKRTGVAGLGNVIAWSTLGLGACITVFSVSPWFYFSLALMSLIGFCLVQQMASTNTLIQTMVPDEYRGRTMAFYCMTVMGLGPFSSLAAGGLAALVGARITGVMGGLSCLLAAALFRVHLDSLQAHSQLQEGT